jgi:hypothetical protein
MVREASRPSTRRFRAAGNRLWDGVTGKFELDSYELQLLTEICRTVDQLELLHAIVAREGVMVDGSQGSRVHPAVVECRQQQVVLAKLLGSLRLPDEDDPRVGHRPQRRVQVRAVSPIRPA